ncbi:MAG: flagellar hook-associated protein FlgK [Parvularculaceae bacterium]
MSISTAVANANSGLSAASRRADLVSGNIANALTPGYARREISVSEQIVGGGGAGVSVDGVNRAADPVLTGERRIADGAVGRDQALASAYADFSSALGEIDEPFSLFGRYQNLETLLRNFAETPESTTLQSQVLLAAKDISRTFGQLSGLVQETRQNADAQIARDVDFVNTSLKKVEALNTSIAKALANGRDSAALEDQRKALVDKISVIIPVRELPRDGGRVDLITSEGVFLLAGSVREITFTQTGVITAGMQYAGGTGVLSGIQIDGVDITPGGSGGLTPKQGSIAGAFAVRDSIAPEFQAQLDSLARDLIERFTDIDSTLPAGAPGLFTDAGAAFDPTMETGLAGRLSVNAAVDPGQGGAVWRLRDGFGAAVEGPAGAAGFIQTMLDSLRAPQPLSAGSALAGRHSAVEAAAGVASHIGAARVAAESSLAGANARAEAVADAEAAVTGVDTDQEMQKLLLIEQAFAANARVIQTAQQMMQTLMEL